MITLPTISDLIQRTRALAALDLILSPKWDSRYYSFNSSWAANEQMASMRNGSGDEWWIVFNNAGWAALKGLDHESAAWSKGREKLADAISAAFPPELSEFAREPAFRWKETSFAYFCLSASTGWRRANDLTEFANLGDTGEHELLGHLVGDATNYVSFAEEYYEKSAPVEIVSNIFALRPITDLSVRSLNSEIGLENISPELFDEIGYPRG